MKNARGLSLGLLAVAAVMGAGWWWQAQTAEALRAEMSLLRRENAQLPALRAEHERLRQAQVTEAELQRLRADHVAVQRLRAEIEAMKSRTETMKAREVQAGK